MILPTKYVTLQNSFLNLGAILLNNIIGEQTVTLLWDKVKHLPEIKNFERFIFTLDLLFTLGLIDLKNGVIIRRVKK